MNALFKADLYKLRNSRSFRVCIIVSFVLGIVMAVLYYYAWKSLAENIESTKSLILSMGDYGDTVSEALDLIPKNNLWSYINISLSDQNVLYLAAIVISIFVGSEYSMGTLRNSVSRGFSRTQIYFSKLLTAMIAALAVIILYVLGGAIPGCIMFGFSASVSAGEIIVSVLGYFVLFIAATSFYAMICTITKKTGYAIAFSLIVPLLITSLDRVIRIGYKDFGKISRFWLFETITDTQQLIQSSETYIIFIVAAVYIALCTVMGIVIFRRQEIK